MKDPSKLAPLLVLAFAACSTSGQTTSFNDGTGGGRSEYPGPRAPSTPANPGVPSEGDPPAPKAPNAVDPGRGAQQPATPSSELTVGLWDDNKNFAHFEMYTSSALFTPAEAKAENARRLVAPGAKTGIDVAFVIDTTASMGDELAYVQREIVSIEGRIHAQAPDTRFGVVIYRDRGDEYVTRSTPLHADPNVARDAIANANADGGGDIPEAVAEALEATVELGWRADSSVAKVVFWIADAEEDTGTGPRVANAIRAAAAHGVHIYPIAASGASERAERTMRSAAQFTGGRYLFLTDDSGIGNPHAVPKLPCYVVQKLDAAMLRVVRIELSGAYEAARPDAIVRVAGTVDGQGRCTVTTGRLDQAWVF